MERGFILKTELVLGGDGKTPISISNVKNPLHLDLSMGRTVKGSYDDGERSFEIQDTNAYFNEHVRSKTQL
ncbi:MAG: hypothetical protein QXF21_02940 [Thermoproteota archaeon]